MLLITELVSVAILRISRCQRKTDDATAGSGALHQILFLYFIEKQCNLNYFLQSFISNHSSGIIVLYCSPQVYQLPVHRNNDIHVF
jgi:hypothetical protein